jgi:hypothetical protein
MIPRALWMAAAVHIASVVPLHAQPWVPAQGEGTASVTYQNYYVKGHYDVFGRKNANGATHAKSLIAEADIGLTDTLALTVSLPFIATKYTGPDQYIVGGILTTPGPLDDRRYHATFQDVHVEVRRMWWAGPIAVAPIAGATIPTHHYETHGEAVPGRHRREILAGAAAGADLHPLLPGSYVHGRYALAVAERIQGFSSVKSNIELEGGYEVGRFVGLRALASWQVKHKGPTIPALAAHDWLGHDRFIVASYFDLGGGVTISLTRTTELHAIWMATLSGNSGAHQSRLLAVGTSWNFGSAIGGLGESAAIRNEPSR